MVKLEDVLYRTPDSSWPIIIGENAWEIISKVANKSITQKELVKFALNVNSPGEIIRDREKRNILIRQCLTDSERADFKKKTGIGYGEELRKNSSKERALYDFLEIPVESGEIIVDILGENTLHVNVSNSLFPYQRDIVADSYEQIRRSNLMIHMPTGSGKTKIAMNLISRALMERKGVVLWLAYSEELCDQAVTEFKKTWAAIGDREVDVNRFYAKHDYEEIDDGLIVSGLSKLWSAIDKEPTFLSWLAKKVILLVFDEAHQSVADTYLNMIKNVILYGNNCKIIGLSATPGRSDLNDRSVSTLFNSKKLTPHVEGHGSFIDYLYSEGYLSKPNFIERRFDGVLLTSNEKKQIEAALDIPQNLLSKIGSDSIRNLKVMDVALEAISSGHSRIVLFAATVKSAKTITALLRYKGIEAICVTHDTLNEDRKRAIKRFTSEVDKQMVLCNYGVLTTGFDAPKITAVIIARPTKSLILYSQMVGRGMRGEKVGGTMNVDIYTIQDINIPEYGSVIEAFGKWDSAWNEQ